VTASTPAFVVVFSLEAPLVAYSTATTESEQLRLEDALRHRPDDAVRELLERVFELANEEPAA